jgi:predicted 3-demethylubiquinone-9 3-methyltransferase (glyoxalase superfamily)
MTTQKIRTCLWFAGNAEEAVDYYCKVFRNAKVLDVARYGEAGPGPEGKLMVATIEVEGVPLMILNDRPTDIPFTHAVSLSVDCDTQAELDALWEKLGAGGEYVECGWLTDKFGVSWQIVPTVWPRLINGPDPAGRTRAMKAMMTMKKLDIAKLQAAYDGR